MDLVNVCEVLWEVFLDIEEGVDFLMVKLVLYYLDIIVLFKVEIELFIVVYYVSGECVMLLVVC